MARFEEVSRFHGHVCPGLAMGYRVSEVALVRLAADRAGDEELVAIVENNSCAVDAIQAMTGCTFGKGNLIHLDHGKQVYTFMTRPSGRGVRIAVRWTPPPEAPEVAAAWEAYLGGERTAEVLERVARRKADKVALILQARPEELFVVSGPRIDLPPVARIHQTLPCSRCGERVMEPRLRPGLDGQVCIPCCTAEDSATETSRTSPGHAGP